MLPNPTSILTKEDIEFELEETLNDLQVNLGEQEELRSIERSLRNKIEELQSKLEKYESKQQ